MALSTNPKDSTGDIQSAVAVAADSFSSIGYADLDLMVKMRALKGGGPGDPYTVYINPRGQVMKVHRGKASKADFVAGARAAR